MEIRRTALIPAILALGLGAGPLEAAGEAYLRNDTGQRLVIHRAPTPGPRETHCPDQLLAGIQGVPGTFSRLAAGFHPGPGATLTLEPGATAVLGWETAPPAGTRACLGIRIGEESRRGFLDYHAPQAGARFGHLAAYRESGRQLQVAPVGALRPTFALAGFQEHPEPTGLDPLTLDPDLDPDLDPARPFPRRQPAPLPAPASQTRRLASRLPLKILPFQAHHLVYLANQSSGHLQVTCPDQGLLPNDPALVAQVALQDQDVKPGAWAPLTDAAALRVPPGQVAVIGLDRRVTQGHQVILSLAMEERKELRLVHLSVPLHEPPTLGPLGLEDQRVMGSDCEVTDTLLVDDTHFKH